jgi:tungstate transport system ATP-binding protein
MVFPGVSLYKGAYNAFRPRPGSAGGLASRGKPVEWREGALLPLHREVTLLHQSPCVFDRSVFDNVRYGLKVRGADDSTTCRRVVESLEAVGLSGFGAGSTLHLSEGTLVGTEGAGDG